MRELDEISRCLRGVPDPSALLEGFFAFAPVGLQVFRADGHSLVVNRAFRDLFGAEPPPEYNVLHDEIAAQRGVLDQIRRAFRGETISLPPVWYDPRELRQVKVAEGKRVAIAASFFPLFDRSGNVTHVAIAFRDMTAELKAREEVEAERDRLNAREEERVRTERFREHFIGLLGHDLRSPLTAIVATAASLLRRKDVPDRLRPSLIRIANASERMRRMISDLLDFTHTRLGGGLPISRKIVDVTEICRESIDELRAAYPDASIHLEPRGATTISVDADRVSQVVCNLIENAVRHATPATWVTVAVEGGPEHPGFVTISVHNWGRTISPEESQTIFEPYRRAGGAAAGFNAAQPTGAGLGLGLYIVREIVVAHGGSVSVDSTAETGTTFTVRLPR